MDTIDALADLDAFIPLPRVQLVRVEPSHHAFSVPNVVEPHSLVEVTRRILARSISMADILHPVSLVKREPFTVVIHPALVVKKKITIVTKHNFIQFYLLKNTSFFNNLKNNLNNSNIKVKLTPRYGHTYPLQLTNVYYLLILVITESNI